MSKRKYTVDLRIIIDTDEYRIPSDGNVAASLREEILDALRESLDADVKIARISLLGEY